MAIEISVTEARAEFAELINRVGYGGERVVITRHGKPLVALVPAVDVTRDTDASVTVLDVGSHRSDSSGLTERPAARFDDH